MAQIEMPLLNTPVPTWRTVEVTPLVGALYRVEGQPRPGDEWAFKPNELVSVDWRRFDDGQTKLVPSSTRTSVILGHSAIRSVAMLPPMSVIVGAMAVLPRDAAGVSQPIPMAIIGVLLTLASIAGMFFWKSPSFAAKWMLRWGIVWGVFWTLYFVTP